MTLKRKILEFVQQNKIDKTVACELLKEANNNGASKASPLFEEPIAVIGMACRLPDADDINSFWHNLARGRHSIRNVPPSRWPESAYYHANPNHPGLGYAHWGGFIEDIDSFDHNFFSLTNSEAAALDPQQRLMLEVAQHTFEHAGYSQVSAQRRSTGIFIGARMNNYGRDYFESLRSRSLSETPPIPINRVSLLGKSQNFMAAWISDRFDLHGPAMVVDTACSSSLVGLHLACQSLRLGECDMALAGGVDLLIDPMVYVMLSKVKALSPDGRCFAFDSRANGYVPGEGAGAVLLKPLSAAQQDGDQIYALLLASAVNNDGQTMGITTPNMDAQIALLETIYQPERISPESIGYIEAHGTATAIGDPIEIKALTEVFRRHTQHFGYCAVGSLKTNIGHLHSAASIASVLKTILCLQKKALPASLNCQQPNPRFMLVNSPFFLNLTYRPWRPVQGRRRAGVSSFGFGGTNCHVVLEEALENPSRTVSVPSLTTFNRSVCRLPNNDRNNDRHKASDAVGIHPLIDRYEQNDDTGTIQFERRFSIRDVLLRDHSVLGVPMIPGVAWLEWLRVGVSLNGKNQINGFDEITFLKPLSLRSDETVTARGVVQADGHFEVLRVAKHGRDEQVLLSGRIVNAPLATPPRQRIPCFESLQGRTPGNEVYSQLRSLGYLHGPFFQNIRWMADLGEHETFAQLQRAPRPQDWLAWLQLDPGLLDSATIVAFGSNNSTMVRAAGSPFIPMFLGKVRIYAPLPDQVFVHTHIQVWNREMCRCTQTLMDDTGQPCVILKDIVSKRVPKDSFSNISGSDAIKPSNLQQSPAEKENPVSFNTDDDIFLPEKNVKKTALLKALGQLLEITLGDKEADTPFLSLGLDSAKLVELAGKIEKAAGIQLYPTIFFEHSTPQNFLDFLLQEHAVAAKRLLNTDDIDSINRTSSAVRSVEVVAEQHITSPLPSETTPLVVFAQPEIEQRPSGYEPIAVIGMAGRYPGASNLDVFWQRMCNGVDAVSEIPSDRWDWRKYFDPEIGKLGKTYCRWGAFLERVDCFDPSFFGIAPRDAAAYDPQARLFFSIGWETLEHAGYGNRAATPRQTGVWVGYSHDHYYEQRIKGNIHHFRGLGLETTVANQFSHFMDWHGPSLVVNTLCSSSLIAVHQAVRALQLGECEMALAGGVHAALSPEYYIAMSYQRALSPTGRCKTFDASADGYVPGEGVGAILLKPLQQALNDGDRIYGVLIGSAVNHSGRASRVTAPNPDAQTQVILSAMAAAGVKGDDISYVETHGTGTSLGDPLEVGALKKAFAKDSTRLGSCRIGALKSQIGHLESAAGIAGLHKVLLSLLYRQLPPTLHVKSVNPALELQHTHFVLNEELSEWNAQGKCRAGLSSFGMLGANAHIIVEQAPEQTLPIKRSERSCHVFTVSARSSEALQKLVTRYIELPEPAPDALPNMCFTAHSGRTHFDYRLGLVGASWAEIHKGLRHWLDNVADNKTKPAVNPRRDSRDLKIAFLMTGQGSQYPGMTRILYNTQPRFRQTLERCAAAFSPYLDRPLQNYLFDDNELIHETQYAQMALFTVNYALADLWMSWGIQPEALIGHSVGEYAAACICGAMSLEEGAGLLAVRARLMQSLDRDAGSMLAVWASDADIADELESFDRLSLAAVNSPTSVVVSGCRQQLTRFSETLRAKGISFTDLKVSHAFHSPLMKPIKEEFLQAAAAVTYKSPTLPIVSNLTGQLLTKAPDSRYWWKHLLGTVRFEDGVQTLLKLGINTFLETGPHSVLCGLVRALPTAASSLCIPSLQRGGNDWKSICQGLAVLYSQGVDIDWAAVESDYQRIRFPLPTYPFEDNRYWIDSDDGESPGENKVTDITKAPKHPLLGELIPAITVPSVYLEGTVHAKQTTHT